MNELRNMWKALNATIEKTAVLTDKVTLLTEGLFFCNLGDVGGGGSW